MTAETLVTDNDGGDSLSRHCKELTEEYKDNAQVDPDVKNEHGDNESLCCKCLRGGVLMRCCGKRCRRRYHPSCVDPPFSHIPPGFWHCTWCVKKKIKFGVHSVSDGVESVFDSREVVSENEVMQREYFVKYKDLAHAHNCWIPETKMLLEAPKLLAKFKRKRKVIRWRRQWSRPQRLLLKRAIILPKQNDQHFDARKHNHIDNDNDFVYRSEWLVKWTDLGYEQVTWELDDASFMTSSEGIKLIDDYEGRHKRADRLSSPLEANKERKASFSELSVQPSGDLPGFYNQYSSYVNKLRMCWYKGQSALIVDEIDQERVMKVILFILSLDHNVKRPFLIISTSTGLSVWETEFLNLAPSANLVVYKGNKDVRSSIRALEFYNEDGGILFQILLSSSDIIVEDLRALRCIAWEAIIIDECQRPKILGHIDYIRTLAAEMRLLLVSGQIKEDRADYIKLLSFLKSGHHELGITQLEACFSASISNLKSQFEEYVAFKSNSGSTRFVEHWVPAQLSSLQLEQYCSMLLSNSILLHSGQKSDTVDALRDLMISTRKCCNHPYLLDPSLHHCVTRGQPFEEHLSIEIKASGKLQLLEKILFEARCRGLRVVILFQSESSNGSRSIGDILDDVLCQRFGQDCYVRYSRGYIPSKKQAALDTFNDKESGKFVFLMEIRACVPSIKLSSVDTVILFDSDLDPQSDLRCLQKMSISSQFKQLTVFRLYSCFTAEEKVLMLAKEDITLESNMQLFNHGTYHTLLKWGASYLFDKLDDLHRSDNSVSSPDLCSDQSLLNDVICELSPNLIYGGGGDNTDYNRLSFISRVQKNGGEYARDILLFGEREMKKLGNESLAFSWSDLLKGRYPQWKLLSVSSQRIRKTVKHFDHTIKESECENDAVVRKRRMVPLDYVDPKRRKVSKDNVNPKERKLTKDKVVPKRKVPKNIVDTKGRKLTNDAFANKIRKVSKDIIDAKRRRLSKDFANSKSRKVTKNVVNSKYLKTRLKNKKNLSADNRTKKLNGNRNGFSKVLGSTVHPLISEITGAAAINMQFSKQKKQPDIPKSTEFLPKPNISELCNVLHFPKNVKAVAMRILEHIFEHYNINCLEVSTAQAFQISVCWLAASLLKHKIDRKDSLHLAKLHLNFDCNGDEAKDVYSELWKHKKDFSSFIQTRLHVEKCNIDGASNYKTPQLKDLVEEDKQEGFQGPRVSNLMKPVTNEYDHQRKSFSTVLSPQDQIRTETFHSVPYTAHEFCLSQGTPGSFPMEVDAISMESDADERMNTSLPVESDAIFMKSDADERTNAMTSMTAEVSLPEHWNKVPSSSNDPNDVNAVVSSLERQIPIVNTEIAQSDINLPEDPQISVNDEVVAVDNSMSMSTRPAQLNSVGTHAVTWDNTAVPEVRHWNTTLSPVCVESTDLQFDETTLAYMQPAHSNLLPLPQMTMSATPSFLGDSFAAVMALDNLFYHSGGVHCYTHEAEVISQAPIDPVERIYVSPATTQPSTSVLINEYASHLPQVPTGPLYINNNPFRAHSVTSELPHIAYSDLLLMELKKIEKMNEEAYKIHEKKRLQVKSDFEKEFEKLVEKYRTLLQNVDTAVELKKRELEKQYELVLMNKVLAEAWNQKLDQYERSSAQCIEQVAMPSFSSSHVSRSHHTSHMPAQRFEKFPARPRV